MEGEKLKVLITGGAGYIGSNFVHHMLEEHPDYHLVVLDKLTYAGKLENLFGVLERIEFIKGDICTKEDVDTAVEGCDGVINFAAETHVDRSIADPEPFAMTNVFGTFMLLEAARKYDVERYVQVSTDEVYGSLVEGTFNENDSLFPSSPYSASKAGADLFCSAYFRTYGMPVLITRSSNNYGPYQYPEKLIPRFIIRAIRNQSLPLYGDGSNVRDWLYVMDNCKAIDLVFHKGMAGEIYNIGANDERKNIEVAELILRKLGKPESLITFVVDRLGHDYRYSLNSEKVRSLGWSPSVRFEEGVEATISWYIKNKGWWESLLD